MFSRLTSLTCRNLRFLMNLPRLKSNFLKDAPLTFLAMSRQASLQAVSKSIELTRCQSRFDTISDRPRPFMMYEPARGPSSKQILGKLTGCEPCKPIEGWKLRKPVIVNFQTCFQLFSSEVNVWELTSIERMKIFKNLSNG